MLYCIKEFGTYSEITGFRNITFFQAEAFLKANRKETRSRIELQMFDADLIATQDHLYFAVLNALQAFRNKTNISKSLAVETMLYASAQRQIQKAIQRCGIKPETTSMAVVIISENPDEIKTVLEAMVVCVGAEPDETVLEMTDVKFEKIKGAFQVKAEEVMTIMDDGFRDEAVVSLIVERVALLSTQL
ncbi:MAG TPA: KEOPS complex subunit Cgi121 [Candidatus Limnocylindrales bacterium]|nr:KEOPS complex subunit Cgi121 [Candidatus Limnocylindrales bacterium]